MITEILTTGVDTSESACAARRAAHASTYLEMEHEVQSLAAMADGLSRMCAEAHCGPSPTADDLKSMYNLSHMVREMALGLRAHY